MKRDADEALANAIADGFTETLRQLRQRLSPEDSPYPDVDDGHHVRPTLADVTTAAVHTFTEELTDKLETVTSAEHQGAAHEARIASKRLRYVLEPFADVITVRVP